MEDNNRFIVFKLCGQMYAIPISQVKEIVEIEKIYKLPNTPDHIIGVTNLRGKAHMIIDMRVLLNLEAAAFENKGKVIVINGNSTGIIVDEVNEIIQVQDRDIEAIEELELLQNSKYVSGIIKSNGKTIVSLDTDKVVA